MTTPTNQQPLRATAIKRGAVSMLHMRHEVTTGFKDSPQKRWGRLVHMAVFEPITLMRLPRWEGYEMRGGEIGFAHRGDAWAEFEYGLKGRDYLTCAPGRDEDEVSKLELITQAVEREINRWPRIVDTEHVLDWVDPLYGPARCKIDAILDGGGWMELKTYGREMNKRRVMSQSEDLRYPLQLGWYAHGMTENGYTGQPCVFLAVESSPPHATMGLAVPPSVLSAGYEEAREIALRYRACEAVGQFPGPYDDGAGDYERPAWATGGDDGEVDVSNGQTMEASEL